MSNPAIEINGVSKRYILQHGGQSNLLRDRVTRLLTPWRRSGATKAAEEFWALRDVTFSVGEGEIVGIIGRNGAGKSTLLKILSRTTVPTRGSVRLHGHTASLLEVGTGFHPELTGRENIFLNGAILGMRRSEIRRKFDEIVAFAEVERFLDTAVKHYSSGMYVRLAFAVAAHLEPDILIIDEVLAVGDAAFQKKCLGKMQDVSRNQGRTVLFVSHNLGIVSRLCQKALLLEQGQVKFYGDVQTGIAQYMNQSEETGPRLSVARRTVRSKELTILSGMLLRDDAPSAVFSHEENIRCRLEIEVRAAVRINAEIILRDEQQVPVGFLPAAVLQGMHHVFAPGRHVLEIELRDLRLASGTYTLDVMLTEHMRQFYDYLESAFTFKILPSALGVDGWQFDHARGQGTVLLAGECRVAS
jgi:lipopolysaccharide transport system ATP-binding protein